MLLIFLFPIDKVFSDNESNELSKCYIKTHCVRENWKVDKVSTAFKHARKLILETPRTSIIEEYNNYIHAEAQTKWLHYTDDLELIALPEKGLIQIRSESRVGIGDNGVNQNRIDKLSYKMSEISSKEIE